MMGAGEHRIRRLCRRAGGMGGGLLLAAVGAGTALAAGGEGHGNPWVDLLYKTVNFAVLVGLLVYFLRKPVGRFLRTGAGRSKELLNDARRADAESERRLAEQRKNIDGLKEELTALQADARREADEEKARLTAEAREIAERFRRQVQLQTGQARNQAVAEIRREIAAEAVRLAEGMIRDRMDDERQGRLVQEHVERMEAGP